MGFSDAKDDVELTEPEAQLEKVFGNKRIDQIFHESVVEPFELLRLVDAGGKVPLEALKGFFVPEARPGIQLNLMRAIFGRAL